MGVTGAYDTPWIAEAEVRFEWFNSILVREGELLALCPDAMSKLVKGGFIGIHTCCIHYRPSIGMIQSIL